MKRAGTTIFGIVLTVVGVGLFIAPFAFPTDAPPASGPNLDAIGVMVSLVLIVGGLGVAWEGLTQGRTQRRIIESGRRTGEADRLRHEEAEARQEADQPRREAEIARLTAEREEGERAERQRVDVERRERDPRRQARIEVRAARRREVRDREREQREAKRWEEQNAARVFKAKREAERQRESWTGWDAPQARRNREARLARLEVQRQRLVSEMNERRDAEREHADRVFREYLAAEKREPIEPVALSAQDLDQLQRGDRIEADEVYGHVRVGDRGTILDDDPHILWDAAFEAAFEEAAFEEEPQLWVSMVRARFTHLRGQVIRFHLIGRVPLPPPSTHGPWCRTCGHWKQGHVSTEHRCGDGCECVGFSGVGVVATPLTDADQERNDRRAVWYISGRCASCGTARTTNPVLCEGCRSKKWPAMMAANIRMSVEQWIALSAPRESEKS